MRLEDAESVANMIDGHWNMNMNNETKDLWVTVLMPEDAKEATAAVARMAKTMHYPPKIVDFKDVLRMMYPSAPEIEKVPIAKMSKIPLWVRRWIAARYLYRRFGREQDLRPFPEQSGMVDPLTTEWMPKDEWVTEAARVTDADVWGSVR